MDGILPVSLDVLAPSAIAGIAVLAVLTGRLVPRRTYDDKAHEADEWRAEARIKDQQIAEQSDQLRYLAEVGKTVEAIMGALQKKNEEREVPQ